MLKYVGMITTPGILGEKHIRYQEELATKRILDLPHSILTLFETIGIA